MALHTQTIDLDELTSDPSSPSDGSIWYNSTDNQLKARINGVTYAVATGWTKSGTEVTPTTPTDTVKVQNLDVDKGVALGGGNQATLGTTGGSGPTATGQAQWLEVDINGVPHWIPVWT